MENSINFSFLSQVKCLKYWPDMGSPPKDFLGITVATIDEITSTDLIVRHFTLRIVVRLVVRD